ncbi:MAG: SPOR domain-containing protein [Armatimonadetes bacterium]|nr:SPOR domain-containing protein [Armatimonadota bacterium]
MAKSSASAPPPRNRSRKKSSPRWPWYAGGFLGLFIVTFLVGMYGLSRPQAPAAPDPMHVPGFVPVEPQSDPKRVRVTELAGPPRRIRETAAPEHPPQNPATPTPAPQQPTPAPDSPPAVSAPTPAPQAPLSRPAIPEAPSPTTVGIAEAEAPPPAPSRKYRVQAGAFQEEENARRMADRLASSGYQPAVTTSKDSSGTTYRVQVGPFPGRNEAEEAVRDLGNQGISARIAED